MKAMQDESDKKCEAEGLWHVISALKHSIDGFETCFKSETAFRQEVLIGVLNMVAVSILPFPGTSRLLLVILWLGTVCVELLNSAIEVVVDLASPEWHILAKRAKDYGSAAVLCSHLAFFGCWVAIVSKLIYAYLEGGVL